MSWFQRLLLKFGSKWKSYTISLILAASIAANVAVWKTYLNEAKKAKFSQATVKLIKAHGNTLAKTEAEIEKIVKKANSAKELASEADPFIAEKNIPAAKAKIAEARKRLDEIPGILEKLKFEKLQAELAVIKARVKKEPELAKDVRGIEENEARLRAMIAWKEKMIKTASTDLMRIKEKEAELK